MEKFFMILTCLLAVFNSRVMGACKNATSVHTFGDSLVDSGVNNYLQNVSFSIARANHTPYGIDYPNQEPTGRFNNGKVLSDFYADYCGIARAFPFLDPRADGTNLFQGVNYASGGAAILDDVSSNLTPYNFSLQIQWFKNVSQRLIALEGQTAAALRISKAIYVLVFGSNDFSQKMLSRYASTPDAQYRSMLIDTYKRRLQELYSLGARRMHVSSVGPLGCTPIARTLNCNFSYPCSRACNENTNNLAIAFNRELRDMLATLNSSLPGSAFSFSFDTFDVTLDAINHPANYGFNVVDRGCCASGYVEIGDGCIGNVACPNRRAFLWFDATHPSEYMIKLLADRSYPYLS